MSNQSCNNKDSFDRSKMTIINNTVTNYTLLFILMNYQSIIYVTHYYIFMQNKKL